MRDGEPADYVPLMNSVEDSHNELEGIAGSKVQYEDIVFRRPPRKGSWVSRLDDVGFMKLSLLCACLVSLLSFFVSAASFYAAVYENASSATASASVDDLRHPSLYLGLDRTPQIKEAMWIASLVDAARPSPIPSIESQNTPLADDLGASAKPRSVYKISRTVPDKDFPSNNWVLLTENEASLLEFSIPGSGTSRCILASVFPDRPQFKKILTIEGGDQNLVLVDIWDVTPPMLSKLTPVSWNDKPTRRKLLGTLSVAFGRNSTSIPFDCQRGTSLVFELGTCRTGGDNSSGACRLEYREDSYLPRMGFQLTLLTDT